MSTICPLLMQLWSEHREVSRVVVGVDPEVFYPPWNPPGVLLDKDMAARGRTVNLAQDRQGAHRVLRVGWVGNPDKPYKKYELIREAVDGLPGIEFEPVLWSQGRGDIPKSHLEMAEYYRSLDVYVCLSDHEGLPTPATECSLCGVPVISVPVGVIPELVVDGETGFVVDQSSKALREKLAWMVEHPAETARMGEAMAVRAQYQAWPRAVKEWIAFIKNEPMTAEESPDADEA